MQPHLAMFFCDVVAFFFSTSTTNYNVFFLWNNELASKKHCKNNSKLNSIDEVLKKSSCHLTPIILIEVFDVLAYVERFLPLQPQNLLDQGLQYPKLQKLLD